MMDAETTPPPSNDKGGGINSTARRDKQANLLTDLISTLDQFPGAVASSNNNTATTTRLKRQPPPPVVAPPVDDPLPVADSEVAQASDAVNPPPMVRMRRQHSSTSTASTTSINDSPDKRSSSFSNSYGDEWTRLFMLEADEDPDTMLDCLKAAGLHGELMNSRFRSVCWRLFFGALSKHKDNWVAETRISRNNYTCLKQRFIVDPHSSSASSVGSASSSARRRRRSRSNSTGAGSDDGGVGLSATPAVTPDVENPLSQEEGSVWNRYFLGGESKRQIHQDVVRTFPEVEFFHSEEIRASMVNILFCFSQTSYLAYKQGMHEILAPLIFVLHCDHMAYQHSTEIGSVAISQKELADYLLDPTYLEHDAYSLFEHIMHIIGPWYDVVDVPVTLDLNNKEPFQRPVDTAAASCAGIARLNRIRETLLRSHDLDLYLHLEHLEIVSQMYGLRWIRLLFGREFTLQDLLVVWDALFAQQEDLILVDYIFIAMLMQVRDILLHSDFSEALCTLMRYPPGVDAHYIVATALHLYKPGMHRKPTEHPYRQIYFTKNQRRHRGKIQRTRSSLIGLESLTSKVKSTDIYQRISGITLPNFISRPNLLLTSDKSASYASDGGGGTASPSAGISSSAAQVKTRHHSSIDRYPTDHLLSATSDRPLGSCPATPTQEPLERTPSAASTAACKGPLRNGRNGRSNGAAANDFQEFIEIRLPHERKAEADTLRELLELCAYCYLELDGCVELVRSCLQEEVEDISTTSSRHATCYRQGQLKTTLDKLAVVRDLLGGLEGGGGQAVVNQFKRVREEPGTSASSGGGRVMRSRSSNNLTSYSTGGGLRVASPASRKNLLETNSTDKQKSGSGVTNGSTEVELKDFRTSSHQRRIIWDD